MDVTSTNQQQQLNPGRAGLLLLVFPAIAIVAAILTVLADDSSQRAVPPPADAPAAAVSTDDLAPQFELAALAGGTLRLADFAGRVVFVNFWATWCGPCRRELPAFAEFLAEQDTNGATIIAIDNGESAEQVQTFLDEIGVQGLPIALDPDMNTRRVYGVFNLPTTFVIAPDGTVATIKFGEITLDDLRNMTAQYG